MSGVHTEQRFKQVPDWTHDEHGKPLGYADPVANKLAREQRVREDFIAYEQLQLLRRRLNICYREEGVNHYENCRDIAEEYYKTLHAPNRGALYSVKKE